MRSSDPTIAKARPRLAGAAARSGRLRRDGRDGARHAQDLGVIGPVYPIAEPTCWR